MRLVYADLDLFLISLLSTMWNQLYIFQYFPYVSLYNFCNMDLRWKDGKTFSRFNHKSQSV